MRIELHGNTVRCFESLDEGVSYSEVAKTLERFANDVQQAKIELDLSGVPRANSVGILALIKAFRTLGRPISYVNAPGWLVAQFNMIAEFLPPGFEVKTFECRFYSPAKDETISHMVEVGGDVPLLESYDEYEVEPLIVDGVTYEPDFDPAEHFFFLTSLAERQGAA